MNIIVDSRIVDSFAESISYFHLVTVNLHNNDETLEAVREIHLE